MQASYHKYILNFKIASGTSRGVMTQKETWFLIIQKENKKGIGECGILRGLSADERADYEEKLQWVCLNINLGKDTLWEALREFPSIQFGIEMAFLSLEQNNPFLLFSSNFTNGTDAIPINGLVWMGNSKFMKKQIEDKITNGFSCIKLKIGAIDFNEELKLLKFIRKHFSPQEIEIRVDANEAFSTNEALNKIYQLYDFNIHSIEQPIKKNNAEIMSFLCKKSPLPIALDEELIGVFDLAKKEDLLKKIQPQYIILKPSFIGGFKGSQEWIMLANKYKIGWWITSALESNIGLNAIAQWTYTLKNLMPQGLGTGMLYTNNINCPLQISKGQLWYDSKKLWDFNKEISFLDPRILF